MWRDVTGWAGEYQVSNQGCVRSVDREAQVFRSGVGYETRRHKGKVLKPSASKNGYLMVSLTRPGGCRAYAYVHRLVAEAFIGPCPEGFEVCHNNGARDDNRADNLRYDTRSKNALDRHKHGTMNQARGERHFFHKLTEDDVRWIRANEMNMSRRSMARALGVCHGTVNSVANGKHWRHVS